MELVSNITNKKTVRQRRGKQRVFIRGVISAKQGTGGEKEKGADIKSAAMKHSDQEVTPQTLTQIKTH